MQVQNLLRHAMSETISEGVINCLIVTNSSEANVQLTRIHEHLFARKSLLKSRSFLSCINAAQIGDPTVACVWRRQTFTAAVEQCTPEMSESILKEQLPTLLQTIAPTGDFPASTATILEAAYDFSRMLHSASSGSTDTFYRAFVPELGSTLYPRQIELVKRCMRSERGETDRGNVFVVAVLSFRRLPISFQSASWGIYFPWSRKSNERAGHS